MSCSITSHNGFLIVFNFCFSFTHNFRWALAYYIWIEIWFQPQVIWGWRFSVTSCCWCLPKCICLCGLYNYTYNLPMFESFKFCQCFCDWSLLPWSAIIQRYLITCAVVYYDLEQSCIKCHFLNVYFDMLFSCVLSFDYLCCFYISHPSVLTLIFVLFASKVACFYSFFSLFFLVLAGIKKTFTSAISDKHLVHGIRHRVCIMITCIKLQSRVHGSCYWSWLCDVKVTDSLT